jgi:hypothetical protein
MTFEFRIVLWEIGFKFGICSIFCVLDAITGIVNQELLKEIQSGITSEFLKRSFVNLDSDIHT